ncbi:MAG: hypothetical protein FJ095_02465 [Deltaproteobacteria bacterium]|nr:hypothetical protein [Deltaproteobacteria bacterium]
MPFEQSVSFGVMPLPVLPLGPLPVEVASPPLPEEAPLIFDPVVVGEPEVVELVVPSVSSFPPAHAATIRAREVKAIPVRMKLFMDSSQG